MREANAIINPSASAIVITSVTPFLQGNGRCPLPTCCISIIPKIFIRYIRLSELKYFYLSLRQPAILRFLFSSGNVLFFHFANKPIKKRPQTKRLPSSLRSFLLLMTLFFYLCPVKDRPFLIIERILVGDNEPVPLSLHRSL